MFWGQVKIWAYCHDGQVEALFYLQVHANKKLYGDTLFH